MRRVGGPGKAVAAALALVACALVGACSGEGKSGAFTASTNEAAAGSGRGRAGDPRWAVPVERTGLPNLHKVSDVLYRGAQPEPEGIRELKAMGVRTIVNLRKLHSDRDEIGEVEIGYEHVPMNAWHPEHEDVVRFLRIAGDPDRQPVFVHCRHGADRTGLMAAVYRVAVEGWSKEDAAEELRNGGFGFHEVWRGIPRFLRELDVEQVTREAGIASGETGPPRD